MLIGQLAKPWYVWRPWQLARRARAMWTPPTPGYVALPVAWGVSLMADPGKTIGRSIWTTGVYDLTVSELLARLIRPGDTVLDAGANVGYMTLLAAVAAGRGGRVVSWEPHPELFSVLERNVQLGAGGREMAQVTLRNAAVGDASGVARLVIPAAMDGNDGLSYIGEGGSGARSMQVRIETVDEVLGGESASVMKIDVEGFELRVLDGAREALAGRRVRHVVFEDHASGDSEVVRRFVSLGYEVFSVGWSLRGLTLGAYRDGKLATDYEAPSYLASLDPDEVRRRCASPGWKTLSARFPQRSGTVGGH